MAENAGDVWVLLDHEEGVLSKVSLQLLTAARSLGARTGGSAVAVFCGTGWEKARDSVARYGAARALVSESTDFGRYQPGAIVETLTGLVRERTPWGVVFPSGPAGKEVAARAGARLGLGVLADAISVSVDGGVIAEIGPGLLILVGVGRTDADGEEAWLASQPRPRVPTFRAAEPRK